MGTVELEIYRTKQNSRATEWQDRASYPNRFSSGPVVFPALLLVPSFSSSALSIVGCCDCVWSRQVLRLVAEKSTASHRWITSSPASVGNTHWSHTRALISVLQVVTSIIQQVPAGPHALLWQPVKNWTTAPVRSQYRISDHKISGTARRCYQRAAVCEGGTC